MAHFPWGKCHKAISHSSGGCVGDQLFTITRIPHGGEGFLWKQRLKEGVLLRKLLVISPKANTNIGKKQRRVKG